MFKSKKRLLLAAGGLLSLAALGTAGAAVGGRFFDFEKLVGQAAEKETPPDADGKPAVKTDATVPPDTPSPGEFAPSPGRVPMGTPYQPSPGQMNSRPTASPAVYPAPGEGTIIRGNDDGSFRPGSTAQAIGGAGGASVLKSPPTSNPAGSFDDSSGGSGQRFLPPSPTPMPVPHDDASSRLAAPPASTHFPTNDSPAPAGGHEQYGNGGYGNAGYDNAGSGGSSPRELGTPYTPSRGAGDAPFDRNPATATPAAPITPPGRFEGGYGRALSDESSAGVSPGGGAVGYGATQVAAGGAMSDPGPKQLEGVQAPSLTIEKVAPAEIQVGRQTTFTITVRNVGQADAEEVVVYDQTPRGTRYVGSTPEAARAPDGSLMWQIGALKPGEESTISLQLVPLQEGQIGSVARVAFAAQASASTICTKPLLTVEQTGPSSVLIGESVNLTITISNPGTGVAVGVTLEEDVPDGLAHPAGNELEYEVGDLRPGESRKLELTMKADKPGLISNLLVVRGEGNLVADDRLELEVVAPQLDVALNGPSKRYLERQATYSVKVQNPGTAPAKNIELVTYLPKGLKFVSTDNQGQYDAQNHAVYWSLEELPPRMNGEVTLTAMPVETGQQKLRVEGRGDLGLSAAYDQEVMVEGLAELFFQVTDAADPIEVGAETEYEIQLINQGSKTDTNVRVTARLPIDLKPISGEGPTRVVVQGQDVICEPLARLAPKGTAVYKIRVAGQRQGDHRISVQVVSDEVRTPVTKEESTRVYVDQ